MEREKQEVGRPVRATVIAQMTGGSDGDKTPFEEGVIRQTQEGVETG